MVAVACTPRRRERESTAVPPVVLAGGSARGPIGDMERSPALADAGVSR